MGLGSPVNCTLPCVETCACDPGFVLSGSECVPSTQCGCSYNGHYVPAGEAFWADDACQRLCRCSMEGGHLECQDKGCREGERCQVENGIRDCYPVSHSTCMAVGDPHYYTFDGKYFDFQVLLLTQGNCNFYIVFSVVGDKPRMEREEGRRGAEDGYEVKPSGQMSKKNAGDYKCSFKNKLEIKWKIFTSQLTGK